MVQDIEGGVSGLKMKSIKGIEIPKVWGAIKKKKKKENSITIQYKTLLLHKRIL